MIMFLFFHLKYIKFVSMVLATSSQNVTTDMTLCQSIIAKKRCSKGYDYHIYHWIFSRPIEALNVNNVLNYFSNIHDLFLNVSDLC